MSAENQKTIAVYEKYADEYLAGTDRKQAHKPEHAVQKRTQLKKYLERATAGMPEDAKFFEFGSADGEAVQLFTELGFELQPSDAPSSFVEKMREKGLTPLQFNVLADEFPDVYDGIYSWRTLVHFTKEDTECTFRKVFKALKPGGRYIFNIANSAGYDNLDERWFDFEGDYRMGVDRFFKYWREEDLRRALEEAGFEIYSFDKSGGDDNNRWFEIVAIKPKNGEEE